MVLQLGERPGNRRKSGENEKDRKRNKELYNLAREYAGVAVMVGKDLWKRVEKLEPLESRLLRIRIKGKMKIDLIVAYSPQAEKRVEEKQKTSTTNSKKQ